MGLFDIFRRRDRDEGDDGALPRFAYHPDPLATGAVKVGNAVCACCDRARGYVYNGAPYSVRDDLDDRICPWCIADGSAARMFDATFVQDSDVPLQGRARSELFERTPGYESWQGERWLVHHGDACEFLGDATRADLNALTPAEEAAFLRENDFLIDEWTRLKADHTPKASSLGLYKFRCRRCRMIRLGVDSS